MLAYLQSIQLCSMRLEAGRLNAISVCFTGSEGTEGSLKDTSPYSKVFKNIPSPSKYPNTLQHVLMAFNSLCEPAEWVKSGLTCKSHNCLWSLHIEQIIKHKRKSPRPLLHPLRTLGSAERSQYVKAKCGKLKSTPTDMTLGSKASVKQAPLEQGLLGLPDLVYEPRLTLLWKRQSGCLCAREYRLGASSDKWDMELLGWYWLKSFRCVSSVSKELANAEKNYRDQFSISSNRKRKQKEGVFPLAKVWFAQHLKHFHVMPQGISQRGADSIWDFNISTTRHSHMVESNQEPAG